MSGAASCADGATSRTPPGAERPRPRDSGAGQRVSQHLHVIAPRDLKRPPFEITLETPQKAPLHRQVEAFSSALQTILIEYRYLMAIAQNI